MAKTSVSDWDTTAANNTDIASINIDEGMAPSGVNNAFRAAMAQIASYTRQGSNLTSATTLNLDSIDSLYLQVTGTTAISAVTLTNGHIRWVRATGALPLTASASLVVNEQTTGTYTCTAGELLLFVGGSGLVIVWSVGQANNPYFTGGTDVAVADGGTGASTAAGARTNLGIMQFGTPQNTTSGTAINFTGIPSGVKRIVVHFAGVSTNGTSIPMLQIGDSGGLETSGYTGQASTLISVPAITYQGHSTGFLLAGGWAATAQMLGFVTLERYMNNQHVWLISGIIGRVDTNSHQLVAGSKTLSAELDRLTLTTAGGADTFDAGAMNISYELF